MKRQILLPGLCVLGTLAIFISLNILLPGKGTAALSSTPSIPQDTRETEGGNHENCKGDHSYGYRDYRGNDDDRAYGDWNGTWFYQRQHGHCEKNQSAN